jgi:hypothetical protein
MMSLLSAYDSGRFQLLIKIWLEMYRTRVPVATGKQARPPRSTIGLNSDRYNPAD